MADLLSILSTGAASLAAHRAAAATASHNLENSATPGYTRQRAVLEATLPAERVSNAYIGRGVLLQGVTQARDRFLEAQIPGALGQAARSGATATALQSVSALDPEAAGGLGDALSAFYRAIRAVSQNAGDPSLRQAAVGASRTVTLAFNRTRGALEETRTGLDAKIAGAVTEVNDLARTVASLNGQIRTARASGAEPNDLLDARQKSLDRLAELTGATPVPTSEGDVSVFLPAGSPLVVNDRASTLSTASDALNGGHVALWLAPPGSAPAALGSVGGELGGHLDARDGALKTAVTGVDTLAWDLASSVNAVHQAGFGLDGSTGLALFVVGATLDGAAGRMSVSAAVLTDARRLAGAASAAALPGDAANFNALLATEQAPLSGGLDAFSTLSQVTSAFGASARTAEAIADGDGAIRDQLVTMREGTSGVSIDEELIELQKSQRAYEAVTRVIQASSDMFDTLLQLK